MKSPSAPVGRAMVLVRNDATHDARILKEARTLADLGYDVEVVAVVSERERTPAAFRNGVAIRRLAPGSVLGRLRRRRRGGRTGPPVGAPAAARPAHTPHRAALRLVRWLITLDYYRLGIARVRTRRPVLVHCNDYNTMWIGLAARLLAGSAVVYDSHELWPDRNRRPEARWILLACEALFVRAAHRVITTSPGYASAMARRYRIATPTLVRNASEPAHGARSADGGSGQRPPTAVYVGGLLPGRGLEQAIDALARVERVRLRLVGPASEPYRDELAERARRAGVEDRLELAGAVPPDSVVAAIEGCDVGLALIQPVCLSYRLTLPNKLFEYVAAGIPVLASDMPVMARFVREHDLGIVVAPGDLDAIARGLEELAGQECGARHRDAVRRAAAELTWENERRTLAAVYGEATTAAGASQVTE